MYDTIYGYIHGWFMSLCMVLFMGVYMVLFMGVFTTFCYVSYVYTVVCSSFFI